ncbi:MAG TPA: hypothetical protein VGR62_08085 [Candidatus Binatia bacterium]|jgi:hypothetical protein|nr:hypothetical protein [Candidatus Binatia bacterium]
MATLRRVAMLDLALTLPFALPIVAERVVVLLQDVDQMLGLGTPFVRLDPMHLLFMNLMGVIAVVWNWARLRSHSTELATMDVPARCVVAGLIVFYVAVMRVTPVLLLFAATEIGGAVIQSRALRGSRGR